jgi:hypothetical protein
VQSAAAANATHESLRTLRLEDSADEKVIAGSSAKPEVTIQDQMKQIVQRP